MLKEAERPLGAAVAALNLHTHSIRRAPHEAATNLLDKAEQALERGERDRAKAYAERAVRIPFDDGEEVLPGIWSAHMRLFRALTEAAEECEPDDDAWLTAAEQVLDSNGEIAASLIKHCLKIIAVEYDVSKREARRIRAVTDGFVETRPWTDRALPPSLQVEMILDILATVAAYEDALYDDLG